MYVLFLVYGYIPLLVLYDNLCYSKLKWIFVELVLEYNYFQVIRLLTNYSQ